ncbi:ParB/RepB/Spo0J family partition protein [Caballeronia sordidicola]|uniref:Chromosome (Plasmid) partitioning protein ParB n=1 Tax=Caballeronia sordidicola TaxID=196367 RepID=A0A242MVB9_CABSO|nr:ParB/RepB/Spo0J family partition protein [Caballeronia sordidicola]OTP75377.1 Chromosome (plasmid) partitioning protein ParB [Caballeronia sordidicola]
MAKKGLDLTGMDDLAQIVGGNGAAIQSEPTRANLDDVIEDPTQPRKRFDPAKLAELRDSIKAQGVLEPIGVRPKNVDGKYVIVFGARRYRASLMAGKTDIPIVLVMIGDEQIRFAQLVENVQRDDLDSLEIAGGIKAALDAGFKKSQIATQIGQSNSFVSEHLALIEGPEFVRELAEKRAVGLRTLYYLINAHKDFPAEVEAYATTTDEITRAGVQALVDKLKKPKEQQQPAQQPGSNGLAAAESGATNPTEEKGAKKDAEMPQEGLDDGGKGKGAVDLTKGVEAGKTDSKQNEDPKPTQQQPGAPKKLAIVVRAGEREATVDRRGRIVIVYKDTGELAEIDLEAVEIVGTEEIKNEGAEIPS